MKKTSLLILLVLGIFFWYNQIFAYQDCSYYLSSCNSWTSIANSTSIYDSSYTSYYNLAKSYCNDYDSCFATIQQEYQEVSSLMTEWFDYYEAGDYEKSLDSYQKVLDIIWDETDANYKISESNMVLCYNKLGSLAIAKEDAKTALNYFNKSLKKDNKNVIALYNIGIINYNKEVYKTALDYFKKAYKYTTSYDDIEAIKSFIEYTEFLIQELKNQDNNVTNDFFSYRSLNYLKLHNIIKAWDKVKKAEAYEVKVAIIDDWIYINHPDLSSNIRINTKEMPNDWKDNDKNWYKDDYNGRNFVYNNNNLLPLWTHGTMVAWIIGAIRDNNEWIAWIVKKVKLMPIGVCNFGEEWTCKDEDIVKGINYAIDNWADIINLSLGGTQFNYSNIYNDTIRRAYNKGIVVVIAAWNGDVLTNSQNWVDTSVNPLSPLCNYWDNHQSIIWVAALDASWHLATWSNFWKCTPFYSLGEWIFSSVIPENSTGKLLYNFWKMAYDFGNWTSFATPIVAGIIGLWFNKYGKVRPDLIWDALTESMGTGYVIDASKYIDILWEKINKNPSDYKTIKIWTSYKISEIWYSIKKWFSVFIQSFKKSTSTLDSIKSANLNRE